jgi:hypothetical protein
VSPRCGRHAACLLLGLAAPLAVAHDPITTKLLWTQEISRIVNRHCASCHREGGAAMSLETYDDARPWAKAIRDEVLARRMPPWGAVKGVGDFRDDPSLSQIEIDMIVHWVEGGAPKGDDIYLPPAPHFGAESRPQPAAYEMKVETASPRTLPAPAEFAGLRPLRLAAGESLEVTAYEPVRAGGPRGTAHLASRLAAAVGAHLLLSASYAVPEGHAYRGLFGQTSRSSDGAIQVTHCREARFLNC